MNILQKKTGHFVFIDGDLKMHTFTDYDEVPDVSQFSNVIAFLPDIPYPPHTIEEHEIIMQWNEEFKKVLEQMDGD